LIGGGVGRPPLPLLPGTEFGRPVLPGRDPHGRPPAPLALRRWFLPIGVGPSDPPLTGLRPPKKLLAEHTGWAPQTRTPWMGGDSPGKGPAPNASGRGVPPDGALPPSSPPAPRPRSLPSRRRPALVCGALFVMTVRCGHTHEAVPFVSFFMVSLVYGKTVLVVIHVAKWRRSGFSKSSFSLPPQTAR